MKSSLFILFSLLLFANSINARKDIGGYWRAVMKDQPMPEAIPGLVHVDPITTSSTIKDFEPNPRLWIYDNGVKSPEKLQFLAKDLDTGPSGYIIYEDDVHKGEKSFTDDFEPRPNLSVYQDDVLKGEKSFTDDFEPRPNLSVYQDDALKGEKSVTEDFEPRPNI